MADVIVSSTTDDLEDVQHAAGVDAGETEVVTEEVEAKAPQAEEKTEEQPEEKVEAKEEVEEEAPRPPKSKVQRRFDKLTARNYELEETNAELQKRLEAVERAQAGKPPAVVHAEVQSVTGKPKPTADAFKTYDEYVEALADWKAEEKWAAKQAEQQQVQLQQRQQETFQSYNHAVSEARAEYEDFDEVIKNGPQIPKSVQIAIIQMRDQGPEVAYRIAQDPDFCDQLVEIMRQEGDAAALVEFGGWVRQLSQPVEERVVKAPVSRAPRPIKPVGSSPTRSSIPLDDVDYQTYRRVRAEQERARFRR
jgi:hypothetical protein